MKRPVTPQQNTEELLKDNEVYTMNPEVWGALPYDLLAISCYNLGNKQEAIEFGEKALEFEPNNTRLSANLNYYRQ